MLPSLILNHTIPTNLLCTPKIFLVYSSSHKGYKCMDPSGRVFISKDVVFNELRFPFPELFPTSQSELSLVPHWSPQFGSTVPRHLQTQGVSQTPVLPFSTTTISFTSPTQTTSLNLLYFTNSDCLSQSSHLSTRLSSRSCIKCFP